MCVISRTINLLGLRWGEHKKIGGGGLKKLLKSFTQRCYNDYTMKDGMDCLFNTHEGNAKCIQNSGLYKRRGGRNSGRHRKKLTINWICGVQIRTGFWLNLSGTSRYNGPTPAGSIRPKQETSFFSWLLTKHGVSTVVQLHLTNWPHTTPLYQLLVAVMTCAACTAPTKYSKPLYCPKTWWIKTTSFHVPQTQCGCIAA
jgi:hypothetical protein